MHRTMSRRTDTTRPQPGLRWAWLVALCCVLSACAGGSGSSGFDALAVENAAIDRALQSQGCETNEGLRICASTGEPSDTATPTQTLPRFTLTPSPTGSPAPTGSPTPTTTPPLASTPTDTPRGFGTPTPTATPIPLGPSVGTNIGSSDRIPCQQTDTQAPCIFMLTFQPQGLPPGAAYRVAVRTRNPDGPWLIVPVTDDSAAIALDPSRSGGDYQIAVLVFPEEPGFVPEEVELLADSGAYLAFITPVLSAELSVAVE